MQITSANVFLLASFAVIISSTFAADAIVFPGEVNSMLNSMNMSPSTRNFFLGRTSPNCALPSGAAGDCLPYSRCRELQTRVAQTGLTPSTISFLRLRVCGVNAGRFSLCCEKPTTPARVSTARPGRVTRPPRLQNIIPTERVCGLSVSRRIIRGKEIAIGEHPWLVGLGTFSNDKFQLQCGGTLITRRHVLSASHCFISQRGIPRITHVRLGEHSLSRDDELEPVVNVRIVKTLSPGYSTRTHVNDIELIEMRTDVVFSSLIKPICLPFDFRNSNFNGQNMTIVGWGDTRFSAGEGNDVPLRAAIPVVSRGECDAAYRRDPNINISNRQICGSSEGSDACQGDSGGPFIYEGNRHYIMGIVSFGVDCASGRFPGVYTFIPAYLEWIQDNL